MFSFGAVIVDHTVGSAKLSISIINRSSKQQRGSPQTLLILKTNEMNGNDTRHAN